MNAVLKSKNTNFVNIPKKILIMFFRPELGWSVLELLGRSADSIHWTSLQKQETKRDRRGFAYCLSDA